MSYYRFFITLVILVIAGQQFGRDAWALEMQLSDADVSYLGPNNYRYSGWSISSGDVDGDGINDLLIGGSPVYLVLGKNIGTKAGASLEDLADASFIAENSGDDFGDAVCMSGDVNNDGYDDILIGADRYDGSTGKTYLVLGKQSGWSMDTGIMTAAAATFTGENTQDWSGYAVASIGDINGDDFDDFMIGAYMMDFDSLINAGRTYLFLGRQSAWQGDFSVDAADARINGDSSGAGSGRELAAAGDVNGDGYDDFLVSAPGRGVYLFFGMAAGWNGDIALNLADASFLPEAAGDSFGSAIAPAGDVNNDGYADFLIGADGNNTHADNAGKVYLVFGKSDEWDLGTSLADSGASYHGEEANDHLGVAVSGAGDINNDGFDDILIGATWADQYTGKAYLVFGNVDGWAPNTSIGSAEVSFAGEAPYDYAGFALATAGDIDRDGSAEFLISAAYFGSYYTGKVYLYYGDGPVTGDLNGDGTVNLTDVITGLKVLAGVSQTIVFDARNDVDGGAVLGLAEVLYGLQKTAGLR